ncbi:MAG: hypothetical protein Q8K72_12210, partial [Acidimicrobiales bacterium]|nr:hypothetical protein [Acidimicrobiales bacterium]
GMAVGVGVLGIGPAGAATELRLSPASGPPGTAFVVTGTGFAALPVEIRWGGLSGPVIATAMGPAFSVPGVVPDSPPNSHPVLAVVTDGGSVSTSSASFQVTAGEAPAPAETTTTITTLAQPPTTSEASIPRGETGQDPISSGTQRGGLSGGIDGGVGGGVGGGMADTADSGTPAAAAPGGGSATVTSTATSIAAEASTSPTVPPPAGGDLPAATPQGASSVPAVPGDGMTAAAAAPPRTSQSAGAVSNPALLLLGLARVFGGGVFLAVRNRHRA